MEKFFLLNLFFSTVFASPVLNKIVSGKIEIFQRENVLYVINKGENGIIEWEDFSLEKGTKVLFLQKDENNILLNRVVGKGRAQIDGEIHSNGQIYLICDQGISFGSESFVDSHVFLASSLDIKNASFTCGKKLLFLSGQPSSIINLGVIRTEKEAYFLSSFIENKNAILSQHDIVYLMAGCQLEIDNTSCEKIFDLSGFGKIVNKGFIKAIEVKLEAKAEHHTLLAVIQDGIIETQKQDQKNGKINLKVKGAIEVNGVIESLN